MSDKFWTKADKNGPAPEHMPHLGRCWIYGDGKGYGSFYWNGKSASAHRASWEIANGPIPTGLYVLHHCDNPACVRPDHLFIGTARDNMQDCIKKGRRKKRYIKARMTAITEIQIDQSVIDKFLLDLIKLLKLRMINNQESVSFLAEKMGLSGPVLWRWLNHKRPINLGGIRKIAAYFREDREMIAALTDYALNGND